MSDEVEHSDTGGKVTIDCTWWFETSYIQINRALYFRIK